MKHIQINSLCHLLVLDDGTSIVLGSPPEWIKTAGETPFPQFIFLGNTVLNEGINYCEVGFPMFKNFFFNKQRKTRVVAPAGNIDGLKKIVRDSLLGPEIWMDDPGWGKARYFKQLHDVHQDFNPNLRILPFEDFIGFESYDHGMYRFGDLSVELVEKDTFRVESKTGEMIIRLVHEKASQPESSRREIPGLLSLFCFDSGDGFCVNKGSTSFMLNIGGSYMVFDPNIHALDMMRERGYDPGKVRAVFISHVHQDHNQGLMKFLEYNPDIMIITGEVVASSVSNFLCNILGSAADAERYQVVALKLRQKNFVDLFNVSICCDISYHSIPTVMTKIYFHDANLKRHVFAYSGDTIFDPVAFQSGNFNREYARDLKHFFDDTTVIIHEAGAGLFHTDPEDLIPSMREDQDLFWVHTFRTEDDCFSRGRILKRGDIVVIKK